MPKYGGKQIFSHGSFPEVVKSRRRRKKKEKSRWKQWPASLRPPPRVVHASTPGPKKRRVKVDNNNGQQHIATPPQVAHAKPPGPKVTHKR